MAEVGDGPADPVPLLNGALQAVANAVAITDSAGNVVWVNPAFTQLTGYSSEEIVGKSTRLLKSGKNPPEIYEELWKTVNAGRVWRGELQNRRKDGTFYEEEMTITPVRDNEGRVSHFIAIKQNITDRKRMEQQLLRSQRMEGIGMLAGGIAHDLNNVLAPIMMAVDLLKAEEGDPETRKLLETVASTTKRGAAIVRQVLTFARGVEGERVGVQPCHVLMDIATVIQETFPKDIQMQLDVANDLGTVKGDATQLHQVMLNLCVNARDAMPNGGRLCIEARKRAVDESFASMVSGATPGTYVAITVTDTGTGMSPETQDRIFEPFFTTKPYGKGTGLGLPTALGIVRSHGGFFQVRSKPGDGSQFSFYLPVFANGEAPAGPQDHAGSPTPGNGELVLVVDDEESVREVTRTILIQNGYRVLSAVDGTDGLVAYAQNRDDVAVVITDVVMPYLDGVCLSRSILRMDPKARIIISTGALAGGGMDAKLEQVKQLGIRTILTKPYMNKDLLWAVSLELAKPAAAAVIS